MARGPDAAGAGQGRSLADQLFNADSVGDLARDFAVLPGFDPERFLSDTLPGLGALPLMARLDHLADGLQAQLPRDFPAMADALEAAMPPPLDPARGDDDFGRFIHAVHGVLAARHGLDHPDRALDLLHAATRRFSMEYAIRPFLNRWPDRTLSRMTDWVEDPHYHVRRLVSEGTRPRLPWGRAVSIDPAAPLPLLDRLHADPTRFVTRSVANHLNDLTRRHPRAVLDRLGRWRSEGRQRPAEMDWITRHALRGAVKRGDAEALAHLGYRSGAVRADLRLETPKPRIGAALRFSVTLAADAPLPVLVDYRIGFARPGRPAEKVFKLKTTRIVPEKPLTLEKTHPLKGNATTFRLHPGPHTLVIQVNGADVASAGFELRA
ncbi:hypothetical protein [Citreimonas sp.]|uniref:hypothetical protein n=1 Tax=Citreimonas sp. TaxID=3036715 RepID=UPI0035C87964